MHVLPLFFYLLFFLDGAAAKKGRNFYKILGLKKHEVKRNPGVVKKAYRELSKKWHPDKNPDNKEEATQKFQDIAAAYEVLSDEKKRADYDQFGEEAPGAGPGGGGGHGHDAFRTFEQFFSSGGGGDGFHQFFQFDGSGGGPFGNGGSPFSGGGKPEKRIFTKTDVAEWGQSEFKSNIEEASPGEFHAVVYYTYQDAGDLKKEYVAAHKTFKGVVELAAINCGKNSEICENENIKPNTLTLILYSWNYKSDKLSRKRYSAQSLSAKTVGNWIRDSLPDPTRNVRSEAELRTLAANEDKALILLFTDKKNVPALIKVLAGKFNKHISVGIVKLKDKADVSTHPVAKMFAIKEAPSLITVTDRENLEAQFFTGQMSMSFLSLFFSRAYTNNEKKKNSPKCRKLTSALYQSGHCAQSVSHFCLVKVGSPNKEELQSLDELARKLKTEHVEVYWTSPAEFPSLAGQFSEHELVLWRPKRRKWKPFEGTFTVRAVADFVDNAVNGGAPLPHTLRTEL